MSRISSIPKEAHWAIVTQISITTPGDERSRTNPGHGYPESTDTYLVYKAYTDEGEWKQAIIDLEEERYTHKSYVAMKVNPAVITKNVNVKVS